MDNQDPPNATPREGKGKARDDSASNNPEQTDALAGSSGDTPAQGSSVFTRIARSAAGLGRDAMTGRPAGSDLGSLTSSAGKAGQARLSAAAGGQSSQLQPGESSSIRHTTTPSQTFSSNSHANQHVSAQEEEFARFLDTAAPDLTMPSEPLDGQFGDSFSTPSASRQPIQSSAANSHLKSRQAAPSSLEHTQSSAIADQERLDGLDVVNLLATGPEEEPTYADIELAEEEIEALRRALFGNSTADERSRPPPEEWDNVLNFIPDFVRPNSDGYEEEGGHLQQGAAATPFSKSGESRHALGLSNSSEATHLWLDQWHDVLTRYDDEVWGGLSHLVKQAREEVDELQKAPEPSGPPPDTKALDRLRQILGHLRG